MLARARASGCGARFEQADVATWRPDARPDLIFGNAVLQWVPDHKTLLPRLASLLAPDGVLAIQMPDNLDEPSHALMREVALSAPYSARLGAAIAARTPLASFDEFYNWLRPVAAHVDLWRTTYVHPLDGAAAIVEWVKATGLRPFVDAIDGDERTDFIARYERALEMAYPRQSDGTSLLRFPRLFIVATRG
jgi:trans-aconitate 2-methyltransferase